MEKIEIIAHYCKESDMSFFTQETRKNNELTEIKNIGFCFGETSAKDYNILDCNLIASFE